MDTNPEKTTDRIHRKLTQAFAPELLEVIDESGQHIGHAGSRPGGQTHFRVRIGSPHFLGMTKVAAHREIYQALDEYMRKGKGNIHALAIEVLTSTDKENFAQ